MADHPRVACRWEAKHNAFELHNCYSHVEGNLYARSSVARDTLHTVPDWGTEACTLNPSNLECALVTALFYGCIHEWNCVPEHVTG